MDKIIFGMNSSLILYFIKFNINDTCIFKIGKTNNIISRFKSLRHEFKIAGIIEVLKLLKIENDIIEAQTLEYFRTKYPELKYDIVINNTKPKEFDKKLYFINLGGYDKTQFTELHKNVFIVADNEHQAKIAGQFALYCKSLCYITYFEITVTKIIKDIK